MNCAKLYPLLTADEKRWLIGWFRFGRMTKQLDVVHDSDSFIYKEIQFVEASLGTLPFIDLEDLKAVVIHGCWILDTNRDIADSIRAKIESL